MNEWVLKRAGVFPLCCGSRSINCGFDSLSLSFSLTPLSHSVCVREHQSDYKQTPPLCFFCPRRKGDTGLVSLSNYWCSSQKPTERERSILGLFFSGRAESAFAAPRQIDDVICADSGETLARLRAQPLACHTKGVPTRINLFTTVTWRSLCARGFSTWSSTSRYKSRVDIMKKLLPIFLLIGKLAK
jgi:hypothetical protein